MAEIRHFSSEEISCVTRTFGHAEKLAGSYFRLTSAGWKDHQYDVKTLSHLEKHEVNEQAFAQLCKYCTNKSIGDSEERCFYRICLQDNRILDAVERGSSFIKLIPLMLYIATHELVHIFRFNTGESDFEAPLEEKVKEEEKVHVVTKNILQPVADREINLVLDCFDDRYHIGDIFN